MSRYSVKQVPPNVARDVRAINKGDKELDHPYYQAEERKGSGKATCRQCHEVIAEGEPTIYFHYAPEDDNEWIRTRGTIHRDDCEGGKDEWTKCPKCRQQVPRAKWSEHWAQEKGKRVAAWTNCFECGGAAVLHGEPCPACNESGIVGEPWASIEAEWNQQHKLAAGQEWEMCGRCEGQGCDHCDQTGLKDPNPDNPMFPNGQCPACGSGLDDEGRCQDEDCPNRGHVVGKVVERPPIGTPEFTEYQRQRKNERAKSDYRKKKEGLPPLPKPAIEEAQYHVDRLLKFHDGNMGSLANEMAERHGGNPEHWQRQLQRIQVAPPGTRVNFDTWDRLQVMTSVMASDVDQDVDPGLERRREYKRRYWEKVRNNPEELERQRLLTQQRNKQYQEKVKNDPEKLERQRQQGRDNYQRYQQDRNADPEKARRYREQRMERIRTRFDGDPEGAEAERLRARERDRRHREKVRNDPEAAEALRQQKKNRFKDDPEGAEANRLKQREWERRYRERVRNQRQPTLDQDVVETVQDTSVPVVKPKPKKEPSLPKAPIEEAQEHVDRLLRLHDGNLTTLSEEMADRHGGHPESWQRTIRNIRNGQPGDRVDYDTYDKLQVMTSKNEELEDESDDAEEEALNSSGLHNVLYESAWFGPNDEIIHGGLGVNGLYKHWGTCRTCGWASDPTPDKDARNHDVHEHQQSLRKHLSSSSFIAPKTAANGLDPTAKPGNSTSAGEEEEEGGYKPRVDQASQDKLKNTQRTQVDQEARKLQRGMKSLDQFAGQKADQQTLEKCQHCSTHDKTYCQAHLCADCPWAQDEPTFVLSFWRSTSTIRVAVRERRWWVRHQNEHAQNMQRYDSDVAKYESDLADYHAGKPRPESKEKYQLCDKCNATGREYDNSQCYWCAGSGLAESDRAPWPPYAPMKPSMPSGPDLSCRCTSCTDNVRDNAVWDNWGNLTKGYIKGLKRWPGLDKEPHPKVYPDRKYPCYSCKGSGEPDTWDRQMGDTSCHNCKGSGTLVEQDKRNIFEHALSGYNGNKDIVGLDGSTGVHEDEDHYHVRLHNTDILKFHKTKPEVSLNWGQDNQWDTATTRDRTRHFLPAGVGIHREQTAPGVHELVVTTPKKAYYMKQGLTINYQTGKATNAEPGDEVLACKECRQFREPAEMPKHQKRHDQARARQEQAAAAQEPATRSMI